MSVERVEAVYREVHARLWRSLFAHTGSREVASDAEAEAFAQLIARGDAVEDPTAWVWRSAFRIAAGHLQRAGEPTPVPVDVEAHDDPSVVELLSLLDGLSSQQRACVVLRYVGGFTPTEIAGLLGTSPGTVRVQLHRAHRTLRASMEDVL